MTIRFLLAAFVAAFSFSAQAQAPVAGNNDTTFGTPGQSFVPGHLLMCKNAAGLAVPCNGAVVSGVSTPVVPAGGTPITASTTGTTAATTATLAAAAGKFTYICGFDIGSTATAAAAGNATVTGPVTGTLNFEMGTGTSPAVVHTTQNFNPCVPSSAVNTAIAVVSAAPGAGGVISVTAWGYQF